MNQYEHSLIAMKHLLDIVGASFWANYIEENISEWRSNRETTQHLSAYGGMGSFNDLWICKANQHTVTEEQEPWANALFEWLKSLCYFLAHQPNDSFTASALIQHIGRYDSVLAAFVGGENASAAIRGYATKNRKLHGWRCICCGYAEASNRDIENMIAQDVVPTMVFLSCEQLTLDELVDQVLARDIPNLEKMRQSLVIAVIDSGIALVDRDGWMRPCPNCNDDDTAVYRWQLVDNGGLRFEPSDDNLPM